MGDRKIFVTLIEVVAVLVVAAFVQITNATTYIVGDNTGWNTPSNGPNTYATWSSKYTFRVGDSLVFNFAGGAHTAAEVNAASYNNCDTGNILNLQSSGPATFTLDSVGTKYFVCTVHCSQGMKFSINVVSSGQTNTPSSVNVPPSGVYVPPPHRSNAPTTIVSFFTICFSIALTIFWS